MNTMTRTIELIEDPETGDLILDLGPEVCDALGWQPGDVIRWQPQQDGSWTLVKECEILDVVR